MNISIFGSGYVGLVTGASLANLGHTVICADVDVQKIGELARGVMPFFEPGLAELVQGNAEKNRLSFTTDLRKAVQFGEVLFICVGTPALEDGRADLAALYGVITLIASLAGGYKVLAIKSTAPPGTARKGQEMMDNGRAPVDIVSNPEFLKQGNAVYDFNHPDKIIIGAQSEKALQVMRKVYHGLIKTYIPFLEMGWETAEMVKYANNAFLATRISYINEIANICGLVGADVKQVAKAIGLDPRIGPKFLNAGIGYGGSCFPKDVNALIAAAREKGYAASLLQEVHSTNERQKEILLPFILEKLHEVQGDTATVWGLSFKPKTSDLREAPSRTLISRLLEKGIRIKVYDPAALPEAQKIWGKAVEHCSSPEESVSGSDLVILATEWDEFRNVDFHQLGKVMRHKIIIDGRNIYDSARLREEGFDYLGVGHQ